MAEIADVLPGGSIESAWGNQIRDRTFQRYASRPSRDALNPVPNAGDLSFIQSDNKYEVFVPGDNWLYLLTEQDDPAGNYLPLSGGTVSGQLTVIRGDAIPLWIQRTGTPGGAGIDMGATRITNMADPTGANNAATRNYVDSGFLPLAGGTMTGDLTYFRLTRDSWSQQVTAGNWRVINDAAEVMFNLGPPASDSWVRTRSGGTSFQVRSNTGSQAAIRVFGIGDVELDNPGTTTSNQAPQWRHSSSSSPYEMLAFLSSQQYKEDIRDADIRTLIGQLRQVRVREWHEVGDDSGRWIRGVVAEEVRAIPGLPDRELPPDVTPSFAMEGLIPHLVAAVQYLLRKSNDNDDD